MESKEEESVESESDFVSSESSPNRKEKKIVPKDRKPNLNREKRKLRKSAKMLSKIITEELASSLHKKMTRFNSKDLFGMGPKKEEEEEEQSSELSKSD